MSLSDIIGRLGLEAAPKVALILFLAAFTMILIGALARSRRQEFEDASRLPLDDDDPPLRREIDGPSDPTHRAGATPHRTGATPR